MSSATEKASAVAAFIAAGYTSLDVQLACSQAGHPKATETVDDPTTPRIQGDSTGVYVIGWWHCPTCGMHDSTRRIPLTDDLAESLGWTRDGNSWLVR